MAKERIDALHKAFSASELRASKIEERLLAAGAEMWSWSFPFFVATMDVITRLYYGAVTNISQQRLQGLLQCGTEPILETVRKTMAIRAGEDGYISRLFGHIAESSRPAFAVAEIGTSGNVLAARAYTAELERDGEVLPAHTSSTVGKSVAGLIDKFRQNASERSRCFVFVKPGDAFDAPESRAVKFLQFGFAFLEDGGEASDPTKETMRTWRMLAGVSAIATSSVFLERERYFDKALRQAVHGDMIKCDLGVKLQPQVELLEKLHGSNVPMVLEKSTEGAAGYYAMSRFVTPALARVFATTAGFEDYEIQALMRACVRHIRETYWAADHLPKTQVAAGTHYLQVRWAQAITAAGDAHATAAELLKNCQNPAQQLLAFPEGARVVHAADISKRRTVLERLTEYEGRPFDLRLNWGGGKVAAQSLGPSVAALTAFIDKADPLGILGEPITYIRAYRIHGDAHLENMLVDASVPEDALVISIDPLVLSEEEIKGPTMKALEVLNIDTTEIGRELLQFVVDPAYDCAKLLLSTACAYGLVNREVFQIGKCPKGRIDVNKVVTQAIKANAETGGISGAATLWREPIAADRAWRYHRVAALEVVRAFVGMMREFDCGPRHVVVALAGLWLLTVRHAFSITNKLLRCGGGMEKALIMYLFSEAFVCRGMKPVLDGLSTKAPGWNDVEGLAHAIALPELASGVKKR